MNSQPKKPLNRDRRTREYLMPEEVEGLMKAARHVGRHWIRDYTIILIMNRHGLRVSEAIDLRWEQIDFGSGLLHVRRLKSGNPSIHPLYGIELRSLYGVQRKYPPFPYVFTSELGSTLSDSTVRKAECGYNKN